MVIALEATQTIVSQRGNYCQGLAFLEERAAVLQEARKLVLEGVEREQRFGLRENSSGDRWLIPLDESVLTPGHTSALIPPEENFHRVRNVGEGNELAGSIHTCGADLEVCTSSINEYFDGLQIRADECSGVAVPWRQARVQTLDARSAPMPANE